MPPLNAPSPAAGQAPSVNEALFDWRKHLPVHPACDAYPVLPRNELITVGNDIRKPLASNSFSSVETAVVVTIVVSKSRSRRFPMMRLRRTSKARIRTAAS
jgi:hypothetical protein